MGRLKRRLLVWLPILSIFSFLTVSCKTTQQKATVARVPVEEVPQPPKDSQLPALPETPAKPVIAKLQQPPAVDPVATLIKLSRSSFERGEKNLKAGFLEKAKKDFDESVVSVLRSGLLSTQDPRLERHYDQLLDTILKYELTALKEGDGFNEEKVEEAPLDEISSGEVPLTFDPRSKMLAEETLQETLHDIPLPINDIVLRYVDYFQGPGRKTMEAGMQRAGRYREMISRIFAEEGVPQDLLYLCQAESAFKPLAYSRAKCKGLWQFGSATGSLYGLRQNWWVDERSDPEKSTRAAAQHLKDLYAQFGDWLLAMAAYNWGANGVERAVAYTGYADYWELMKRNNLPAETKNYIPIILAMTIISKDPGRYGFDVVPDPPIESERVPMSSAIDLRLVAESLDMSLGEIQELNPHVKRLTTPNNDPDFNLYVPLGLGDKLIAEIEAIPEDKRVNWRKHRIEEGETLSQIARKYRTTTSAIAQANGLQEEDFLRMGDKLIIPVTLTRGGAAEHATSRGSKVRYVVRRGDTLSEIARHFEVSVAQLRKWNGLRTNSILRVGRVISIYPESESPGSTSRKTNSEVAKVTASQPVRVIHRVKRGDTLHAIAANYRTTVDSICDWNNLSESNNLRIGEHLTIYVSR